MQRVKVSFMIDKNVLLKFYALIPVDKRDDFVNAALEEALDRRIANIKPKNPVI